MHPSLNRPVQLRLLGEFAVAVDDISTARAIRYTKPRLLLAILALAQGKAYRRSELATMLWPSNQQDSLANLRQALFVLRKLLKSVPHAWASTNHTLALDPDVIMVDVLALTGSYTGLSYQERLAYDRGGLLEYLDPPQSAAFTAWHSNWQARIGRDIAECRAGLVSQLVAHGQQDQAVGYAKQWALQHPTDESAHRHLVQLLRDTGNEEAASLALNQYRATIRESHNESRVEQTQPPPQARQMPVGRQLADNTLANTEHAQAQRQYRPLAVLAVTLALDHLDVEEDNPLQDLHAIASLMQTRAEAAGAHVQTGADGSLLVVFGFPTTVERPAHACARLACALRETTLPETMHLGLGMHADIGTMHPQDPRNVAHVFGQRAMRLAYLADPGEVLLTAGARDRIIDEFTVHYETRHGHAHYVLDSLRKIHPAGRMFGRLREFDTLVRLWARLPMAQAPTSVLVRGEPGIGKSLLAGVMGEYVRRTDGEVKTIYCEEGHKQQPFHPVRTYLCEHMPHTGNDGNYQDKGRLEALNQFLYPEANTVKGYNIRHETLDILESALLWRSRAGAPLLIIWEDLHWADPSSLALIEKLQQRTQVAPTLLLLTARTEFQGDQSMNQLDLPPLDRRAMAELVMHRTRGHRISASQRDRIVDNADGIPLFADEIVRQVATGGEIGATPVILDLISVRISALAPMARQLAQLATITGRLDDTLISRAKHELGITTRQALALVQQLRRHGLIDENMPAQFCHALTRDAIYKTMDPTQRKAQHAKVAQFLINRDSRLARTEAAYIAHHLDAARHASASRWWCVAGRDALAQLATTEAQTLSERAMAALDYIEPPEERRKAEFECQLLRGSVFALLKGGGAVETSQIYERVAQLHQRDDSPDMQCQMQWGAWFVAFNTTPHAQALHAAQNLMLHAERHGSDMALGSAQFALGQTRLFMGDIARAERWLRDCLHTLGNQTISTGLPPAWGMERAQSARAMLAWVHAMQGRGNEAISDIKQELSAPDDRKLLASRIMCQAVLCELHRLHGDVGATLTAATTLKEMASTVPFAFWRTVADSMAGWALVHHGDSGGLASMERAIQVAKRAMPVWQASMYLLLADSQNTLGRHDQALEIIEHASTLIDNYGTQLVRGFYLRVQADALEGSGQMDQAINCWQHAVAESRRLGLSLAAATAEAQLEQALTKSRRR